MKSDGMRTAYLTLSDGERIYCISLPGGCRYLYIYLYFTHNFFPVHRVHWLRARASQQRWAEEFEITKKEMQWTTLFYMHMAKTWKTRQDIWDVPSDAENVITCGHCSYAKCQIAMWNEFGRMSEAKFRTCIPMYPHIWECIV